VRWHIASSFPALRADVAGLRGMAGTLLDLTIAGQEFTL